MLEDKGEGAGRWMVLGELMMIEIMKGRIVLVSHVDHTKGRVSEVSFGGVAPENRHRMQGQEDTAREELILMGTAGMSKEGGDWGHGANVGRWESGGNGGSCSLEHKRAVMLGEG